MDNLNEQHFLQTISKNLSFELDYSAKRGQEVKHINFQLQDQHSSSTESTAMGKTSSQDQCASSDSGHDESFGKNGQDPRAALFLCNPELSINASQAEISQPIVSCCLEKIPMQFPYAYSDPYITGLYAAYGPHNMIQPQLMAATAGRVPLPVDLPEDGPIYVNAKQYHGILRRRQSRAKLEAQNKLVKARKPYLHESRHQHALKRVRGSGGRFLSTKKSQQFDSLPETSSQGTISDSYLHNQKMLISNEHQIEANTEGTRVSTAEVVLQQQPDGRLSSLPSHMGISIQSSSGLVLNGNRHYASIVR
ncbi:CCAAT-binding factor, subunit B (HAP2) [Handroanthus impetiginosus]|uniref:Nuclear transcription factor Y subunit n=1 Tax=Handroanthus impetiginosus TaxID=429701 RepID=A0A2G9HRD3_9LAMI|nr:CCAAT-binding factor, subunit B (HAP2) [Handroanthus impetiginosus]